MHYTIRHVTNFSYDVPISESVMEARMQPRTEGTQRCHQFGLTTRPASSVMVYRDHEDNFVHHFDIPGRHSTLAITTQALVECTSPPLPTTLDAEAWSALDARCASGEFWELQNPTPFARWTPLLLQLAREFGLARDEEPVALLQRLMRQMFETFEYSPETTRVDSPIDEALASRRGVCQDFTHIFIALVRRLGVPCRYVSGYLFHPADSGDRSSDGATHAWAEAWLPENGWVGFDPTNNLFASERHIRVAVGRDYTDVPPTRGVYKGLSAVRSELAVGVSVGTALPMTVSEQPFVSWVSRSAPPPEETADLAQQQQQQQQ